MLRDMREKTVSFFLEEISEEHTWDFQGESTRAFL